MSKILSRAPSDAKALGLLNLKHGDWLEWAPIAAHASCYQIPSPLFSVRGAASPLTVSLTTSPSTDPISFLSM